MRFGMAAKRRVAVGVFWKAMPGVAVLLLLLGDGVGQERDERPASGWIDVTEPRFGAAGDGKTDNTAAIQRAIDAGKGTVVYFPAGTYLFSESLMNTEGVTLQGADREATVLQMTDPDAYGISMASGLRVRSLTLRGSGTPSPRAHGFNGGNTVGAVSEDCIIEEWGAVAILGADNSHRNVVRNNEIRNNAHEGVYFGTGSDDNVIEGNHIHHCLKNGIDINGSRNRVLFNRVHDIGAAGDTVDTVGIMAGNPPPDIATDNLIHGNTVSNCATHGIILWAVSKYTVITDNIVFDNAGYGIFLEKLGAEGMCAHHIVGQNVARDNAGYGIILEAAVDCVVSGNQTIGNGKDGIAIDSTNGPAARNVVTGNVSRGITRHGVYVSAGSLETVLSGNSASDNGERDVEDGGSGAGRE